MIYLGNLLDLHQKFLNNLLLLTVQKFSHKNQNLPKYSGRFFLG